MDNSGNRKPQIVRNKLHTPLKNKGSIFTTDLQNETLKKFELNKNQHLFYSLIIDLCGMMTYLLPLLGEFADLIYAPFSGVAIFVMYKRYRTRAILGGFGGFIEELLPGTDFIPTATLMWAYTYIVKKDATLEGFAKEKKKELDILNNVYQRKQRKGLIAWFKGLVGME